MRQLIVEGLVLLSMIGCGNFGGKSGPSEPTPPVPYSSPIPSADAKTSTPTGASIDGTAAYERLCASCHGSLEQTKVPRANLDKIKAAIAGGVPEMKELQGTSDSLLSSIVDELAKIQPGKGKAKNMQ